MFRRRGAPQPETLADTPPAEPAEPALPVLLVAMLDLPEAEHPKILEHLKAKFGHSHKLVFLLSTDTFTPYLRHQVAIESFPSIEQQLLHRHLIDWPSYLAEKWELLLLKWRPETVLSYGLNPQRYLAQVRALIAAETPDAGQSGA